MSRRYSCLFIILWLLAVLMPGILGADPATGEIWGSLVPEENDSYRLGKKRLQEFAEIAPYIGENADNQELRVVCGQLNPACRQYLEGHRSAAVRALPNNPVYWQSFKEVLMVTPLARVPDDQRNMQMGGPILKATKLWVLRQWLLPHTSTAQEIHFVVQAQRRLLAESNFLTDKMVYLAGSLISLGAINALMAQHAQPYSRLTPPQQALLDEMLVPMSKTEASMRLPFHGEVRYGIQDQREEGYDIGEAQRQDRRLMYEYIVGRSEANWNDLWGNRFSVLDDVPLYTPLIGIAAPAYKDYVVNLRYLDVQLTLLRALREIYEGRTSPGIPGMAPPTFWEWRWGDNSLCLKPVNIHASMPATIELCAPYLDFEN